MATEIAFAQVKPNEVQFRDANGTLVKSVTCSGAVSAQSTGNGFAVTMRNGSVRIYDKSGCHLKTVG